MSESEPTRVLLADDHPVVREGIRHLLETEPGLHLVGEAADGEGVVEAAGRLRPDVILMDLVMPRMDGIEATRRVLAENDATRVLVLTSFGADDKLFPALKAGARGFLLKEASGRELVRAIRRVAKGEYALCPAMARRLVKQHSGEENGDNLAEPLTGREIEVLRLIAAGESNAEIAERLSISPATVRTHISHILAKLHLTRRTQAAVYALRHGIASLEDEDRGSS